MTPSQHIAAHAHAASTAATVAGHGSVAHSAAAHGTAAHNAIAHNAAAHNLPHNSPAHGGPTSSGAAATGATATLTADAGGPVPATAALAALAGSAATGPGALAAPRKLAGRRRRETVAVLLFSGAPIFESSIPLSVFGVDRQDAGVPRYRLLVCAGEDGPLTTTGGLTLTAPYGLEALSRAGTIVVPAWRSISQPPPVEAIAALRKAHHEGARIIGLCTGAFVLAAAGLLDGRPATTHWMYAPTLAKRYPRVHVDPRELFVDDGDVLTSAGTAAGIDLCLHVVRSDHGAEAANALARRLVVPNRRGGGGQAQYIDQSLPEEIGNDPLAEVVTWALENLNQQFDVEVLAARAYMSRRTFDRRFRTLTGSAPLQWLITQRVLQAQRLLETSDLSVDDVARRCGFRSPVALRGHFRRQLGVSPAAYRTTFRARRPSGANATVPSQGPAGERALQPAAAAPSPSSAATTAAPGPGGNLRQRPRPLVPPQPGPPNSFGQRGGADRSADPRVAARTAPSGHQYPGQGQGQAQTGHPGHPQAGQQHAYPQQQPSHAQPNHPQQGHPQPSHAQPSHSHAHAPAAPGQPVRPSAAYPGAAYPGGRGAVPADRPVEHAIAEEPGGEQPSARGRRSAHRAEGEPERGAREPAEFGTDGARTVSRSRDRAVG